MSDRDTDSTRDKKVVGRRNILGLGGTLGAAFAANRLLAACGGDDSFVEGGGDASATDTGAGSTATANDAAADAAAADAAACDAGALGDAGVAWATGGTASMTAKATYPNPFACGAQSTCTVTCELTQGPCYSAQSEVIQDISYGYDGLPLRLYFQVLDESCAPVANATIDVWHVSAVGKYSGDDAVNEDVAFCTGNDTAFTSKLYFRGKQTTDASGVLYFDTCYPGWYSSRTVHIHLTISIGGEAYVTTQLCFDDALDDSIIAAQPTYDTRGARDTTNTTDTVFSASDYGDYQFQTAQMSDGAMLAWKTIIVRKSTSESICGGSSSGGDGGMMGPGGDGGPPGGFDGGLPPGFDGGAPPDGGM